MLAVSYPPTSCGPNARDAVNHIGGEQALVDQKRLDRACPQRWPVFVVVLEVLFVHAHIASRWLSQMSTCTDPFGSGVSPHSSRAAKETAYTCWGCSPSPTAFVSGNTYAG